MEEKTRTVREKKGSPQRRSEHAEKILIYSALLETHQRARAVHGKDRPEPSLLTKHAIKIAASMESFENVGEVPVVLGNTAATS